MKKTIPVFPAAILIMVIVAIAGCNKDDDRIRIEGTVTDAVQGIPVSGAEVILSGKLIQGGTFNPDPSVIVTAVTDAAGAFQIDILQVKASDFVLSVNKKQYFIQTEELTIQEISSGKKYTNQWALHPEGWIRLRVQNTQPGDASDLITWRILSDNPDCSDCCNSTYIQGHGIQYNELTLCRTKAATVATVTWNVHKWGFSKADTAQLQVPLFDTVSYHLTY
jgi:hypothetical protein